MSSSLEARALLEPRQPVPGRRAAPTASTLPGAHVPAPRHARPDTAADAPVETDLVGTAWIVREITHVPGVLRWHDGRLSFESTRGTIFAGTPGELGLEVGRTARAGLRVRVATEDLRVHVVRPAGGVAPCRELLDRAAGAPHREATVGGPESWGPWHARLGGPTPPPARSRAGRVGRAFAALSTVGSKAVSTPS